MRARLAILLICLGVCVIALVKSENVFTSQASAGAGQASKAWQSWCVPGQPPELARVTASQLLDLRGTLEVVLMNTGGHGYVWGPVPTSAVWIDDPPVSDPGRATGGRWPGSFEIRQWAPDPQWGASYSDDIGADVFLFTTPSQALRFFDEATSVRCHSSGSVRLAPLPPQARSLTWVNPDGFTEEDVFLQRGDFVYRIGDVRPQNNPATPSIAERRVGRATVELLACTLPAAGCPARISEHARTTVKAAGQPSASGAT